MNRKKHRHIRNTLYLLQGVERTVCTYLAKPVRSVDHEIQISNHQKYFREQIRGFLGIQIR